MRMIVLGAGRQGLAVAYDLVRSGGATSLTLVDARRRVVLAGARRLRTLLPGVPVLTVVRSLTGRDASPLLRGHAVAVSALPYRYGPALTQAAIRARVPLCDLGGSTELVRAQVAMDKAARRAGITVVPDCGLAPGLGNVLASIAIAEMKNPKHVRIRCGGLPAEPKGPLDYSLFFSIEGLTNEYTGEAVVLRSGKLTRIEAFTECEPFRGPAELGALEAFVTSGGTSTAPWTYRRELKTYDYKTVRTKGHYEKVRAMIDLGLLDKTPVKIDGRKLAPRDVFHAVAGPRLEDPDAEDVVFLRVDCTNARGKGIRYQMLQRFDRLTGFSAMEQTTGYPTAVIAADLAQGKHEPGVRTPERLAYNRSHVTALRQRGLVLRRSRL